MDEWITGFFRDRGAAERAVDELQKAGYGINDISVMMTEDTRIRKFAAEKGSKAPEGAVAGGAVGGALGAIVAGLTATGSIAAIAATGGVAAPPCDQVRSLVDSMRWNYPPIVVDTGREPTASIIIPVFNKFELTYNCIKSIKLVFGEQPAFHIPLQHVISCDVDVSRREPIEAAFLL